MAKYGNGIGIKSMLEQELNEITEILCKYEVSDEDGDKIVGAYKELAFQFCRMNASSCSFEEMLKEYMNDSDIFRKYLTLEADRYQKMEETYPWYDDAWYGETDNEEQDNRSE